MSKKSKKTMLGLSLLQFYLARLRERLWFRPLMSCVLSIAAVLIAGAADTIDFMQDWPAISSESLETVLSIMSASMLVIAMFAVGAMLSAYASASGSATPRAFPLVVADDVSQNALSTFLGSFIFSIVGLVAHLNGFYSSAGRLVLFVITLSVFAIVVLAFVRWVDRIARLGRLGHTIEKVEAAADAALQSCARLPQMGALWEEQSEFGIEVCAEGVGYVQNIDLARLQSLAEQWDCLISISAEPGTFVTPDCPLVRVSSANGMNAERSFTDDVIASFVIGGARTFESDPRFGLIVMSEIASRALSPGVNDPGTAIEIIDSLVRLLTRWSSARSSNDSTEIAFDRLVIPALETRNVFDDAFKAIARDGAGSIEVTIRLQKAYLALSRLGDDDIRSASIAHACLSIRYAEKALILEEEVAAVRGIADQI